MKNLVITHLIIIFLFSACSKEEKKLELFSPDAFAFQLEDGWELNASVQVKGFTFEEGNENYTVRLSYYVNLITPGGDVLEEITSDLITKESDEGINDLGIDTQVELDSSFAAGEYKIIFYVTDDYTGKESTIEKTFELSKE